VRLFLDRFSRRSARLLRFAHVDHYTRRLAEW
jgi:hypothetical protein